MNEQLFWRLIDESCSETRGSCEKQANVLAAKLARLAPQEIEDFDRQFNNYMRLSYNWDLWAAAYILNGGCSDDCFDYFRAWLIAQGSTVFKKALADAESLILLKIDPDEPDVECEEIMYSAQTAYKELTGRSLPNTGSAILDEPTGETWEEDDLHSRLPRLAAKFY